MGAGGVLLEFFSEEVSFESSFKGREGLTVSDTVWKRIPDFGGRNRERTLVMLLLVIMWKAEKSGISGRTEGSGRE